MGLASKEFRKIWFMSSRRNHKHSRKLSWQSHLWQNMTLWLSWSQECNMGPYGWGRWRIQISTRDCWCSSGSNQWFPWFGTSGAHQSQHLTYMVHENIQITREYGQLLTLKVPLGPNSLTSQPLFRVHLKKKKNLRVAEDSEKQNPEGSAKALCNYASGVRFPSNTEQCVGVCMSVFVFWRIHKGQNSWFPFILQHPPFPTPEIPSTLNVA